MLAIALVLVAVVIVISVKYVKREGILMSDDALRGTTYAPLNQDTYDASPTLSNRYSKDPVTAVIEPMTYLTTYEQQDFYRENPEVYPVPQTYTTAKYQFERNGILKNMASHNLEAVPGNYSSVL